MAEFKDRFAYLRKRSQFTQEEMADALKAYGAVRVSRGLIGSWEAGIRMPGRENLEVIADFFKVPMNYLVGKEDDPTSSSEEQMPEITMIGRAARKMTEEQRKDMLKILKVIFPEEFSNDEK